MPKTQKPAGQRTVKSLLTAVLKAYDISAEILASRLRERKIQISVSSIYNFLHDKKPSANLELLLRPELTQMLAEKRKK